MAPTPAAWLLLASVALAFMGSAVATDLVPPLPGAFCTLRADEFVDFDSSCFVSCGALAGLGHVSAQGAPADFAIELRCGGVLVASCQPGAGASDCEAFGPSVTTSLAEDGVCRLVTNGQVATGRCEVAYAADFL